MLRTKTISLATLFALAGAPVAAADDPLPTFDLRYRFTAGEAIRTKVTHSSTVQTSIKGSAESAQSHAVSVKLWKVTAAEPSGKATFEYSIESIAMRGKIGDQAEVVFDSTKDKIVPEMYKQVAKTVGVPLSVVTVDARGRILQREEKLDRSFANVASGQVTLPLPPEPVPLGHVWHDDFPIPVLLDGARGQKVTRTINARQRYKLERVEGGVATIGIQTQILDPALPPSVEVQLLQRVSQGEVEFDLARGRVTRQKMVCDRSVVDFHGPGSLMKCKIEFSEELLTESPSTAGRQDKDAGQKR